MCNIVPHSMCNFHFGNGVRNGAISSFLVGTFSATSYSKTVLVQKNTQYQKNLVLKINHLITPNTLNLYHAMYFRSMFKCQWTHRTHWTHWQTNKYKVKKVHEYYKSTYILAPLCIGFHIKRYCIVANIAMIWGHYFCPTKNPIITTRPHTYI